MRFAAVLLFVLSAFALARAGDQQPWPMPGMEFFLERIPPAPETGGALDESDALYSLAIQAGASESAVNEAVITAVCKDVFVFSQIIGPKFAASGFPKTAAFFSEVNQTADSVTHAIKDHFRRVRPYLADRGIKRLVPEDTGFSYPSGHSTRGWLFALLLGELDPTNRPAYLRLASQIGQDRVLGGMHYQSDVLLSRALAQVLFAELMKNEDFKSALGSVKGSEWSPPPSPKTGGAPAGTKS